MLPCATKMGKTRIARRGSASLARRNRTNHCKKLRLSEFQQSQAGRKESTTRSNKHPAGPKEFVNSSFVAYREHFFLSSTSFKCHLCFHSPHSYIIFRGTSHCKSSSIQVTSANQQGSSFYQSLEWLALAQIQVEFSSSPPNRG